jgi:BTB/POZ domain-containing protein 13
LDPVKYCIFHHFDCFAFFLDVKHIWRWTGFNMGLDLIVDYNNFSLTLKRNMPGIYNEHHAMIATHPKRKILYRLTVVSVNEQKQVTYKKTTGLRSVSLEKNGTERMIKLVSL